MVSRDHFTEDHAVSFQQRPADGVHYTGAIESLAGVKQRPAAGAVSRTRVVAFAMTGAALGIYQSANVVEAICGDHAGGYQLPQGCFQFRFYFSGAAHDVCEE
jgi:hypothetical protein